MRGSIGLLLTFGLLPMQFAVAQTAATEPTGDAPTAAEEDSSRLDTVMVTATKREESIYEVPIAITAFAAESIERQGIADLTDIGKFVPNMNVTGFSAGHTSSVNRLSAASACRTI